MSKKVVTPAESGPRDTGKHQRAEKQSGHHATGKDNSECASLRPNHPAKKETKAEHDRLVADHSIVADTNTVFPKHSTGDKGVAAKEAQIKGNRPGIAAKKK